MWFVSPRCGANKADFSRASCYHPPKHCPDAPTRVCNRALPMRQKRKPGDRRAERFPNASGVIARLAYAQAKASGVGLDPLLKRSGLSRRQMDDPDELVRVHDQIVFLNLVADALGDDLLGFHL